jgi:valyl-tRNA synthetase
MDTWATSSLTPQIVCGWEDDPELYARTFPMDLRPQGHDIIRTWLFATVLRSELDGGTLPWRHTTLSGWILDPDRKKMSKSKGNVVTPMGLLEEFGSDAVRYWAASGRPGTDTAFDQGQMKVGRRLSTKLLNAAKFVLGFPEPAADAEVTEPLDRAMLAELDEVVRKSTSALEAFEHTTALERTERFFWLFCDYYVELVKDRAYGVDGAAATESARLALRTALSTLLRLFAPFVPYSAEETWSWWHENSVHTSPWPQPGVAEAIGDSSLLPLASTVISAIRKAKSDDKRSMRWAVESVLVRGPQAKLDAIGTIRSDLSTAGNVTDFSLEPADEQDLSFKITLAER